MRLYRSAHMSSALRNYALAVSIFLAACATTKVQPIVITGHVLDGAGMTFESVEAGMVAASNRNALTREQTLAWNDFRARWSAGYMSARKTWKEAKANLDEPAAQQALDIISSLLGELATWQTVVAGGFSYELPREESRYALGDAP